MDVCLGTSVCCGGYGVTPTITTTAQTSDQPNAETYTLTTHNTHKRHIPRPRRGSNRQSKQANSRTPTPSTVRPVGLAIYSFDLSSSLSLLTIRKLRHQSYPTSIGYEQ
jgi:hypothetical protein